MRSYFVLLFLFLAPLIMAETPPATSSTLEGGLVLQRLLPAQMAKPRLDGLTWTILAADGGARALDAYSTVRMLKNSCGAGRKVTGVSTCNYEQNLPGFITNHTSGIYAFDGTVWLSEFAATRFLVRHNRGRLARFLPFIDFISTTSFAVNNLTLSVGKGGATGAPTFQVHFNGHR